MKHFRLPVFALAFITASAFASGKPVTPEQMSGNPAPMKATALPMPEANIYCPPFDAAVAELKSPDDCNCPDPNSDQCRMKQILSARERCESALMKDGKWIGDQMWNGQENTRLASDRVQLAADKAQSDAQNNEGVLQQAASRFRLAGDHFWACRTKAPEWMNNLTRYQKTEDQLVAVCAEKAMPEERIKVEIQMKPKVQSYAKTCAEGEKASAQNRDAKYAEFMKRNQTQDPSSSSDSSRSSPSVPSGSAAPAADNSSSTSTASGTVKPTEPAKPTTASTAKDPATDTGALAGAPAANTPLLGPEAYPNSNPPYDPSQDQQPQQPQGGQQGGKGGGDSGGGDKGGSGDQSKGGDSQHSPTDKPAQSPAANAPDQATLDQIKQDMKDKIAAEKEAAALKAAQDALKANQICSVNQVKNPTTGAMEAKTTCVQKPAAGTPSSNSKVNPTVKNLINERDALYSGQPKPVLKSTK
ncbi:MAG: hypothetical protein JST16_05695 [Bdellovibrionales bacterium]|nr:hypothetical protein [Bdellovibrionales bacterium]